MQYSFLVASLVDTNTIQMANVNAIQQHSKANCAGEMNKNRELEQKEKKKSNSREFIKRMCMDGKV